MLALCCILLLHERSIGYLYIDIFLEERTIPLRARAVVLLLLYGLFPDALKLIINNGFLRFFYVWWFSYTLYNIENIKKAPVR